MRRHKIFLAFGLLTIAALAAGCGGAGLVVIPPEVENAKAPEGKYGNVHAIYLYDVGYVHYDPIDIGSSYGPDYAFTRFTKIKLLTRAAVDTYYGTILFDHFDELYGIVAHIEKPDGTKVELGKGDFLTTILVKDVIPDRTPPIHFYRTTIIFPGLDIGDTIVYRYTKRSPELSWNFNQLDAPVLYSKFMFARPPIRTEIQPVIYDRHDLKPEKTTDKGMATGMMGYTGISRQATYDIWTVKNSPAIIFEEAMPPVVDLSSRVLVWQSDRKWPWSTQGETYHKWFTHYGRPPSKPKELAQALVKDIAAPRERARVIHDWVKKNLNIQPHANLTYVPRQIEIERIDIDELLEEKNAAPEKVANLMWLMMNAVGVEATIVLVTHVDSPPVLEDLPSTSQFTHPLLALDDGTLIDTTNRLCPFGMIPWAFEGRKALWIKGGSVALKEMPVSDATDNQRHVKVNGKVDPDGSVKTRVHYKMTGQMAYAWRKWFVPMTPKEKEVAIRSVVTTTADKAEVDNFEFENLENVDKDLEFSIDYHVPGYAQVLQDKMVFKAGAFVHHTTCPALDGTGGYYLYVCPKPLSETRNNPVQFPFRRYDEMDIGIDFPTGFLLQALPKGFRTRKLEKGTSLGVQTSYGSKEGKKLHVIRKFSVNEPFIDKDGYELLRDIMRRFEAQKDTLITLEIPGLSD
jgi:transglutaminase superfamily protein